MAARKRTAPANARTKKGRGCWRRAFLKVFAECGVVGLAAEAAGVSAGQVRRSRREDPEFAEQYREARERACDALEAEARRRGLKGVVRKKFDKGRPLIDPATKKQYVEYEYSDTLLIFLLKAHRPAKYRERHEVKHKGSVRMELVEEIQDAPNGPPHDQAAPGASGLPPK